MNTLFHLPEVIQRDAEFDDPARYGNRLRWWLCRWWGDGDMALFLGCNPSLAGKERDDPSVKRSIKLAKAWGIDGLYWMNPIPFVDPDPKLGAVQALRPGWHGLALLQRNLDLVRERAKACRLVIACWGDLPRNRDWYSHCARVLIEDGIALHCLGTTATGNPKHPMARGKYRVADNQQPLPWSPT